jgi:hypothetical protein
MRAIGVHCQASLNGLPVACARRRSMKAVEDGLPSASRAVFGTEHHKPSAPSAPITRPTSKICAMTRSQRRGVLGGTPPERIGLRGIVGA